MTIEVESTQVAEIFEKDINKLCADINAVIEAHNKLVDEKAELEKYKHSADELNEIERLNKELELYKDNQEHLNNLLQQKDNIIKEAREYIEENQEEHKYTDRGGFTYTEGHFLRDSDTLLEILDKEKDNE